MSLIEIAIIFDVSINEVGNPATISLESISEYDRNLYQAYVSNGYVDEYIETCLFGTNEFHGSAEVILIGVDNSGSVSQILAHMSISNDDNYTGDFIINMVQKNLNQETNDDPCFEFNSKEYHLSCNKVEIVNQEYWDEAGTDISQLQRDCLGHDPLPHYLYIYVDNSRSYLVLNECLSGEDRTNEGLVQQMYDSIGPGKFDTYYYYITDSNHIMTTDGIISNN